jgi:hypothetical protein
VLVAQPSRSVEPVLVEPVPAEVVSAQVVLAQVVLAQVVSAQVVSVDGVEVSVLLLVDSLVEVLLDELDGGTVVLVVVVGGTVVVRFTRVAVVVVASVVVACEKVVRGVAAGRERLEVGASVAVACELRWRAAAVLVVALTAWASARGRGAVVNPTRLPPSAPTSTATMTEVHRRDSTNRIGLKTGSPRVELP